jgi:phosphoglycerate dehydrogenase-like enzyme
VGDVVTICVPDEAARGYLDPLPDGVRVLVWNGTDDPPDGIADTEFLLGSYMGGPVAETVLAALPQLRVIQLLSAGVERWLPIVPTGVTLCNGRGVHGGGTAELAVTGILALVRQLPFFLGEQAASRWSPRATDDLDGKRLLVLGAGDIGHRVAAALEVFGAQTTYVGRSARDGVHGTDELRTLLPSADIVVVAIPETDETRGLVDTKFLAALPDEAIVANIARGSIVDTEALLGELRAERLYAFLDVTDPEPLPADHPLWTAPNLIITPHVGGGTHGWERRGYRLVRAQIERFVKDEPLENVVGVTY